MPAALQAIGADSAIPSTAAFHCIVADPPWAVKAGPNGGGYADGLKGMRKWNWRSENLPTRKLSYPSMSVEEIMALQVASIAADDAHLYLWTINRYVKEAYDVARAWGFEPSTLLTWAKNPMGGGLGGTFGISTEYILFARRGSLKAKKRVKGTWFNWKREYVNGAPSHSRKPSDFMTMVEAVTPGPYLELFARRRRPGWSVWGNEIPSDITLESSQQLHLTK
jgi:N6-adenosine-specific RNA methylase IME4